mmetsp:Transcript_2512/g.3496  ORF Transcript_2512/g.3496 Transcript_2512/m.3496 type:complete len:109 (-) Transcript_2512:1603-1929(-)
MLDVSQEGCGISVTIVDADNEILRSHVFKLKIPCTKCERDGCTIFQDNDISLLALYKKPQTFRCNVILRIEESSVESIMSICYNFNYWSNLVGTIRISNICTILIDNY